MSTLRQWLEKAEFNWETGLILYQPVEEGDSPGWANCVFPLEEATKDHPILDHEFYSGYGGPRCPRIWARDDTAVYFPAQYDGATWLERVEFPSRDMIGKVIETPYPGG